MSTPSPHVHPPTTTGRIHADCEGKIQRLSVLVIGTLLLKAAAKIAVGISCHLTAMFLEGIRTIFEIVKHIIVRLVGHHARANPDKEFPLGKRILFPVISIGLAVCSLMLGYSILSELLKIIATLCHHHLFHFPHWPTLLRLLEPGEIPKNPSLLAMGALVMLISSAITWRVNVIEMAFGKLYQLFELEAEADDNRATPILEFCLAICFGITALAMRFHWGHPQTVHEMMTAISLAIVFLLLLRYATKIIRDSARDLVGPKLNSEETARIQDALDNELPNGVSLKHPIVAFRQATAAFVSLRLEIPTGLLSASHSIAMRAKALAESYLRDDYNPVKVDVVCEQCLESDLIYKQINQSLRNEWKLTEDLPAAKALHACMTGDLTKAGSILCQQQSNDSLSTAGRCAHLWINLYGKGPGHPDTLNTIAPVPGITVAAIEPALAIWYSLTLTALSQRTADSSRIATTAPYASLLSSLVQNNSVDSLAAAEALFALGIHRLYVDSDAVGAQQLFRQSEIKYLENGYSTFVDRLYTSWGHLMTLEFRLSPARVLLESACHIKNIKGDMLGLSFSYGCLADCYSRDNNYDDADINYDRDISICRELGLNHIIPGIYIKKALNLFRKGTAVVHHDSRDELEQCHKIAFEVIKGNPPPNTAWFAFKEIAKSQLFQLLITEDENTTRGLLIATEETLSEMRRLSKAFHYTPYNEGLYGILASRLSAVKGEWIDARNTLQASIRCLNKVYRSDGGAALVPLVLQVEAGYNDWMNTGNADSLTEAVNAVAAYRIQQRGFLDNLNEVIEKTTTTILNCPLKEGVSPSARKKIQLLTAQLVAAIEP